jgi:hypothetical protein
MAIEEAKLAELKQQHGKVIVADFEEATLVFRKFSKGQIQDLVKNVTTKPNQALELTITYCKFVCVFGLESFDKLAESYPLAFTGSEDHPGVAEQLISLSRGSANFRVV